jgi:hypothetical protein
MTPEIHIEREQRDGGEAFGSLDTFVSFAKRSARTSVLCSLTTSTTMALEMIPRFDYFLRTKRTNEAA